MPPDASKPADAGGVNVPPFADIATHKLNALRNQGWAVAGYAIEREGKYGFVTAGAMVGWWLPEYYPDRHTDGSVDALQSLAAENTRLTERAEAAEREAAEAAKALEDGLDIRMRHMHFGDGEFDMEVTGEAVNAVALAFVSNFKSSGTANYIEMNIFDRDEPFQRYTVTVQKIGALSPADKTKAAEASLTAAQQTIERLTEALRPFGAMDVTEIHVDPTDGRWEIHVMGATQPTFSMFNSARAVLSGEETK